MAPQHDCSAFRRDLDSRSAEQVEVDCEACRDWSQRSARLASALSAVPRRTAPDLLTGLVEDELRLAQLERRETPSVLERLVDEELVAESPAAVTRSLRGLPRLTAPDELAERVEHELAAPAAVDRTLRGLTRLAAPEELTARLEQELAQPAAPSASRRPLLLRRWKAVSGLAAAAALLILVQAAGESRRPEPRMTLRIVESPDQLGALSAQLVGGLGGFADAREAVR